MQRYNLFGFSPLKTANNNADDDVNRAGNHTDTSDPFWGQPAFQDHPESSAPAASLDFLSGSPLNQRATNSNVDGNMNVASAGDDNLLGFGYAAPQLHDVQTQPQIGDSANILGLSSSEAEVYAQPQYGNGFADADVRPFCCTDGRTKPSLSTPTPRPLRLRYFPTTTNRSSRSLFSCRCCTPECVACRSICTHHLSTGRSIYRFNHAASGNDRGCTRDDNGFLVARVGADSRNGACFFLCC
jgi:hypothetical protein